MVHVDPVGPPTGEEITLAYERTGYRYTDPVVDEAFPRLVETTDELLDEFPAGWGERPTWRDQQAIDAGNR